MTLALWLGSWLGVEGTKALVSALMKMPHTTSLHVESAWMAVSVRGVGPSMSCMHGGAERTGNWLMGVEGVKALVPALMKMPHMTSLNVGCAFWQMWWMGVRGVW